MRRVSEQYHGQLRLFLTAEQADTAKAAHKWMKDNEIVLKNERVQPIAAEAKRIEAERIATPALDAWQAYLAARAPRWSRSCGWCW